MTEEKESFDALKKGCRSARNKINESQKDEVVRHVVGIR